MLREIDQYFLNKNEPQKSCLLALRSLILNYDKDLSESWKYRMPCYLYKNNPFCYLWTDKLTGQPYILMVKGNLINHLQLIQGKRARMKILPIDPNEDIPMDIIDEIFQQRLILY